MTVDFKLAMSLTGSTPVHRLADTAEEKWEQSRASSQVPRPARSRLNSLHDNPNTDQAEAGEDQSPEDSGTDVEIETYSRREKSIELSDEDPDGYHPSAASNSASRQVSRVGTRGYPPRYQECGPVTSH